MTLRFALFGHPVAHSISPDIHTAAYGALGRLDVRYELFDVPDQAALAQCVSAVRMGNLAGANVTVPWKREALALADRAEPSAADVGAANVLVRDAGRVVAYNTDVMALVEEIGTLCAAPNRALVLGNGGASLAAVAALRALGTREVGVSARKWTAGLDRASWPHAGELERLGATALSWSAEGDPLAAFAEGADVVVQATSAGMHGAGPGEDVARVIPWTRLSKTSIAYDLVYNPADTPFLRLARDAGLVAGGGLGMLVAQAARAIELWLGIAPPREPMLSAARAALAARSA